jgi:hypothetical protein
MQLQLLCATSCLSIYYDSSHNWLFLDWAGELTLPAVQEGCVAVAQCYMQRTYSYVLSSNLQVTGINCKVDTWLAAEFLPYMTLVGVKYVAWISAPFLASHNLMQAIRKQIAGLVLNIFDTNEEAIVWLQQAPFMRLESDSSPSQQPALQTQLAQEVQALRQEVQQLVGRKPLRAVRA